MRKTKFKGANWIYGCYQIKDCMSDNLLQIGSDIIRFIWTAILLVISRYVMYIFFLAV